MCTRLLLLLFLCFSNYVCKAQAMIFSAHASSAKVGLQSRFQITYTIVNANDIAKFQAPSFQNFVIVGGPMQSSSFSTINGSSSSSISYTFYLQPKTTGKFIIPVAQAIVDGRVVKSNAIPIEVVVGKTVPSAKGKNYIDPFDDPIFNNPFDKNSTHKPPQKKSTNPSIPLPNSNSILQSNDLKNKVFVRIDVDKTKVFLGEQITVSYNLYTQLPLEAGIKKMLSPEGFWVQEYPKAINPQESERVVENGKEYRKYTLRKTALFATKSGELLIPPIEIEGAIDGGDDSKDEGSRSIIGSMLNQLLNGSNNLRIPFQLTSNSVSILASPLPESSIDNANISTNVGQYTIEGNLDKMEITTDESSRLAITIKGVGNIKMISAPKLSIPGDFETFEPTISDTITSLDGAIAGYKTFKYTLVPRNTGELHISAASFSFFNTQSQQYETINTPPYTIKVMPGKKQLKKPISKLPQDIHDIINDDTMQKSKVKIWPLSEWYWLAYLLPIGLLVATSIYKKRKLNAVKNAALQEIKQANTIALQRLSIAKEMLSNNNANGFYNETSKAIWLYLSDKLSVPLSKLSKDNMWQLLTDEGIDSQLQNDIKSVTQECEQALYAIGNAQNMQATYDAANKIIVSLEHQLS
jgi:hypothetical protein